MARQGKLVLPAPEDAVEFAAVIVDPQVSGPPIKSPAVQRSSSAVSQSAWKKVRLPPGRRCRTCMRGSSMIFPSNRVRIMLATKPVDFRKGHDGLAALVKNELHKDPFTGTVFVFRSRKADRLKLIY